MSVPGLSMDVKLLDILRVLCLFDTSATCKEHRRHEPRPLSSYKGQREIVCRILDNNVLTDRICKLV